MSNQVFYGRNGEKEEMGARVITESATELLMNVSGK